MCHPEVPAGQEPPDVEQEQVMVPLLNNEEMPALLSAPKLGAGPGVLVVADIFGPSPFYENLAGRLALAGFTALVPDYFWRAGPLSERTREAAFARRARLDEVQVLKDLELAVSWLQLRPGAAGPTGTVGFCMGGTLALDLAAERDDLVTVCFYGFPGAASPTANSAPQPLQQLDRIHGPILGFWGDQDQGVGMDNVEKLVAGLTSRGVEFEYKIYPGLGHGFMQASGLDPDKEAYDAACEAWTRTLEFYRRRLAGVKA
jgi:carboxymethylenebutenolidase